MGTLVIFRACVGFEAGVRSDLDQIGGRFAAHLEGGPDRGIAGGLAAAGPKSGAMGWRKARWWSRSYLPWLTLAVVSMMAGSVVVILLGVRHPVASQMTFLQLIVLVWILSSFSEEIYVRGLVQSWMADDDEGDVDGNLSLLDPSIVASALLFGALHVSLMRTALGVWGGLAIVLSTLGVGYACAVLRARSRSLWPAIACHVIGNVAGIPGGILGMIVYRLVHGHFPALS